MIQPFDGGKFDKRFEDVYKPAINAAGLEAYRVDGDDYVQIPIDAIEDKINAATICLADITLNNPNVWYEVGYALARNKTIVLVCSDERTDLYPFDIRQRNILQYKTESPSDFENFKQKLTSRINKLKSNISIVTTPTININVDNFEGLSYLELAFVGALLSNQDIPNEYVSAWGIKEQMKKNGFNDLAFNVCVRKLLTKKFIESSIVTDYYGNEYNGFNLTEKGSEWVLKNEDKFLYEQKIESDESQFDNKLPFN